tara:strand:- start:2125 stop:2622 length:498 start_codon:yes stop_codon:yes gene_type:complete
VKIDTIIIDNFLDNPDKVREQVLTLDFYETGEYPGHRSDGTEKDYQKMVKDKLSEVLQFPVYFRMDRDCFRYQLCLEGAETWIHKDDTEWAGVLYLSPDPPVDGGTVIFDEEENVVTMIGNVYNRLVLYRGDLLHRSLQPGFGNSVETGRLTQVFFFDEATYDKH